MIEMKSLIEYLQSAYFPAFQIANLALFDNGDFRRALDIQHSADKTEFCLNYGVQLDPTSELVEQGVGYDFQARVVFSEGEVWRSVGAMEPPESVVTDENLDDVRNLFREFSTRQSLATVLSNAKPSQVFSPRDFSGLVKGLSAADVAFFLESEGHSASVNWAVEALKFVPKVARARRRRLEELIHRAS